MGFPPDASLATLSCFLLVSLAIGTSSCLENMFIVYRHEMPPNMNPKRLWLSLKGPSKGDLLLMEEILHHLKSLKS